MANWITMHGKLAADAQNKLVTVNSKEIPLVYFPLLDTGKPYQKAEPMIVEVHFMKEAAMHIYPYLVKDKEILVHGFLRQKKMEDRVVFYISAEYVNLIPLYKENAKEALNEKF